MTHVTITIISDTHELHRELDLPLSDILIHAGDFTMMSRSTSSIKDFDRWLGELPHPYKVVCPGNHDYFLEDSANQNRISNATLLINEGIEVLGLKIWGSPATPLYGGAFGLSSISDRIQHYASIPGDTDVLITHGPPFGVLDRAPGSEDHSGCPQLLEAVRRIQPFLHAFGHVHGAHGMLNTPDTLFVNAALLGEGGALEREPISLRIPKIC